ncbi:hypothetical protein BAE44_0021693, partial [Dichanthelium oligosanthes]
RRERTEPITPPPPPPPSSASAAASVLGNDDLLREILLRLGFATCLVRAAAVSRRWLRHASDPAFLRHFRELDPPRLLGFYIVTYCNRPFPRFVPLPQPPELAAVIRRSSFELTDSFSNGNWKLVDTICLLQVFGPLADPSWPPGVAVHVDAVGDNADFVFLRIHFEVFYMCIRSRTVKKVYDLKAGL